MYLYNKRRYARKYKAKVIDKFVLFAYFAKKSLLQFKMK